MIQANARNSEILPSLEAKLRFLQSSLSYPSLAGETSWVETHMSWVFFVGEHVLKLKKPVRYPFLDFSTLPAREFYCREELRLNSRLAPGVYLGLMALQFHDGQFTLVPEADRGDPQHTVDWLVKMRRLPEPRMLQHAIAGGSVKPRDIDALVAVLAAFYRHAAAAHVSAQDYVARFQSELAASREVLLRPQFELADAALALDRMEAALIGHTSLLSERAAQGRLVDGHGDLRPEHVVLLEPPVVIDCLEFNATLRQVDPFDELAFLALECELLGAAWIGPQIISGCSAALGDAPSNAVIQLYTAHRALLRARLAMAHLLDPQPRTPPKWPPLAQRYVQRALVALDALDRALPLNATTSHGSP